MRKTLAAALLAFCVGWVLVVTQPRAQLGIMGVGPGDFGVASGGNAVMVDAVGTVFNSAPTFFSTNSNMTVGSGLTDSALIAVLVSVDVTSITSPSVTWDGVSMTLLANADAGAGLQVMIFGLRNPAAGAKNFVGSWSGSTGSNPLRVIAMSFQNVSQTSDATAFPVAGRTTATTGGTPDSITITTGANNYAVAGYSSAANFTSTSDTQLFISNSGNAWASAANYKAASGASDTLTASPGSVISAMAGISVAHD